MQKTPHLLIFTRFPEPGTTKTRLIADLGADGAAALQKKLTEMTIETCQELSSVREISTTIYFTGGDPASMAEWLPDHDCRLQADGDLGYRMRESIRQTFNRGYAPVLLIGCDIPGLTVEILDEALSLLDCNDVVLGPATDGGYYLVGLRTGEPELLDTLFTDKTWSVSDLFEKTVSLLRQKGYLTGTVAELIDIDDSHDLDTARKRGLV